MSCACEGGRDTDIAELTIEREKLHVDTVTVLRTVLSTTGLNLIKFKALAGVIIQTMPKGSKSVGPSLKTYSAVSISGTHKCAPHRKQALQQRTPSNVADRNSRYQKNAFQNQATEWHLCSNRVGSVSVPSPRVKSG